MLGGGANLLGYYMYHGGINPEGKETNLQESRVTGYNNDLPVKSYDFQTCIRESGEVNESYGRLRGCICCCRISEKSWRGVKPVSRKSFPSRRRIYIHCAPRPG